MRALSFYLLLAALAAGQGKDPDLQQLFTEAVSAQQHGDFALAVRNYRQILKIQPDAVEVKINLGAALVHLGQYDAAIAEYESALSAASDPETVRLNLGLAYYKKGDFEKARQQFKILSAVHPDDARVATLLADCDVRLEDFKGASAVLQPLEAKNRQDADLEYLLGLSLVKSGKPRDGVPYIEQSAATRQDAEAYLLAGNTWLQLNEFEQAQKDLENAVRLNPSLTAAYTQLGVAQDKGGKAAQAQLSFRKSLRTNPDDFEANLYLGAICLKQRRMEEATQFLDHALQLSPASSLARYEGALLKSASGRYEAAAQELEKLTASDPNWLEPHIQLASVYYKLHRAADGAKERATVDRLTADQASRGPQRPKPD